MIVLALGTAAALLGIAILHLYWAAGGRTGAAAALPELAGRPAFTPSATDSLAIALALTLGALVVLGRAGIWAPAWVSPRFFRGGAWLLSAVFLVRAVGDFRLVGFFKRVRGTAFARRDTFIYSPVCLALGLAILRLALAAQAG